ncbi:baseplate assembly protein [Kosakonia phage Kc263]|uniref:Baseplate protein n=1 Tax=Kosakonia phage Kc263 TaxID=2863194 RepID=A0AAE7WF59_9CAUD|nr:baseplate assembly protein [Kosakonia phage Kc263]QYN79949.1 baseplate protein [Kosakonia phage Kc263]
MNILECYGVGTVTMDKDLNTDEIQVHVKSLFPEADGEAVTAIETKNVTTQTPTGDTTSSTTLQSNTVAAKWMALNTNRVTAPDVRKGSKVVVYKFAGQDVYRWTYFGMDGTLRLETVIYAFSASPKVDLNTPVTPDNYYMFMISTHQKKIQLVTGQGNGEKAAYVIELNTGDGQFSIVDSEDNIISLNSIEHAFSYINAEKSFLNIEKKDFTLSCENQGIIKAKNTLAIQCKDLQLKADNSIAVETKTTSWISPDIYFKGNIKHDGNYTQTGNTTIKGSFNQSGGQGTVDGGWTIDGIRYLGHRHGGVQSGGSKTNTPE